MFPLKYLFLSQVVPALNKEGGQWDVRIHEHWLDPRFWTVQLEGFFASHELDRKVIEVPTDWWEHVKQRFAPAWFRKRYPVRLTQHVMEVSQIYPNFAVPKMGRSVQVVEFNHNVRFDG